MGVTFCNPFLVFTTLDDLINMNKAWTIWKYAIGSFSDEKTAEYDNIVAIIRTVVVFINFVTCFFIMGNVIHNW